jgi:hypothetical protein
MVYLTGCDPGIVSGESQTDSGVNWLNTLVGDEWCVTLC